MSLLSALADGCQRVLRAPALIVGLWLAYVVVPAPVGMDFSDTYMGLIEASALDPIPALLSVLYSGRDMLTHAAVVTFLLGGMLDRLARNRATASFGFFGACGAFVFRFVRLDLVAMPFYMLLFLAIYPRFPNGTVGSAIALGAIVLLLNSVFDFAKVRMVVEDRRSAIGGVTSALRFIRRNPVAALGLVATNAALAAATWWLAASFEIGVTTAVYAYLLARALLRLIAMASAASLFQSRLAHAGYTARPLPTWPDSPAAEAVVPQ